MSYLEIALEVEERIKARLGYTAKAREKREKRGEPRGLGYQRADLERQLGRRLTEPEWLDIEKVLLVFPGSQVEVEP